MLVCAVVREGNAVTPSGNFVLREGDRIFVTAPTDTLSILLKNLGIITRRVESVMIVGGGKVSYYLAQALQKHAAEDRDAGLLKRILPRGGIDVQLVDINPERCRILADQLPGIQVICGDASNLSFLESVGLTQSSALVALTGLDELNMVVALYGKNHNIPQIIAKMSRIENTQVIDNLSLGSMISPRNLCCNTIVRYVRAMQNQTGAAVTMHTIADGNAEAIEFMVDESALHCGETLKKLKIREKVLIVGIIRGQTTEIPNGDSHYEVGDSVVIVSSGNQIIGQFNDIFA